MILALSTRNDPDELDARLFCKILPRFVGVNSYGSMTESGIDVWAIRLCRGVEVGADTDPKSGQDGVDGNDVSTLSSSAISSNVGN